MFAFKKIKKINLYFLINFIVILLFNLYFLKLPLVSTFGYEFSAVNSLLIIVLSGLYTIVFLKSGENKFGKLLFRLFFLTLIPFVVSIIHSIFTMFCSFWDGLLFYILITFPAMIIGSSISYVILFFVKKYQKSIFITIILLLALIPILEIYFYPQVYFYSPLIGYFPGNIYDEGLSPSLKLLYHQIFILLFFLIILFSIIKWRETISKNKIKFSVVIILVAILFQFISPALGFTTTYSRLESSLYKKVETPNTILHYDKLSEQEARLVALNSEYYFENLKNKLQITPLKKINIYLFNSREQKKELFGAGNADVAKPWQYCIYTSREAWESTLQHEMVHVFSAEFGSGIFKLANGFNASMVEGLAESIDNNYDDFTMEEIAEIAYHNGYKIDISSLFSGLNFFKQNSSLSYIYSGAFFEFLIQKYGIEKVKSFYGNGQVEENFGVNIQALKKDFDIRLDSLKSFGNKPKADYYFGRLSIIQKVCPRFISDRLTIAWKLLNDKKNNQAENLFIEINQKSLNYSALIGLSEIYRLNDKNDEAINLLNKDLDKFYGTPYYYNLLLRISDLHIQSDKIDEAKYYYEKLVDDNPQFYLKTIAQVRLDLINNNLIDRYISASDSAKYKLLLELNKLEYNYSSIILLSNLAQSLSINYKDFLRNFDKTFKINSLESSYAAYSLSEYMLNNLDFSNSRKMAALSMRYDMDNPYLITYKQNFDKANWFFYNADKISSTFRYVTEN